MILQNGKIGKKRYNFFSKVLKNDDLKMTLFFKIRFITDTMDKLCVEDPCEGDEAYELISRLKHFEQFKGKILADLKTKMLSVFFFFFFNY